MAFLSPFAVPSLHPPSCSCLRLSSSVDSGEPISPPISNQVPLSKIRDSELNPTSIAPVKVHVIAHRGASGNLPDHTLESYRSAFLEGADWIELDVQSTSDHQLIINHDVDLTDSTDVADWAWAAPLRRRTVAPCSDGGSDVIEGWMTSDLTLAEVKQLRVHQREAVRPQEFNKCFQIPTLAETADFLQDMIGSEKMRLLGNDMTKSQWLEERNRYVLKYGRCRPNPKAGLYIETKRPSWYRSIGLPIEEKLVEVLEDSTFEGPVMIQSFERESLARMQELKPEWQTVKLLTRQEVEGAMENNNLDQFMEDLASLGCNGIGPNKSSIIPEPTFPPATSPLIEAAHKHGLFVHPYTFKSDMRHLHRIYGGNASQEFAQFFKLGVDGVFADFPDHGVFARELYNRLQIQGCGFVLFSDVFTA